MKKVQIRLFAMMFVAQTCRATLIDNVSYTLDALSPSDPLNSSVNKFRKVVKTFYQASHFVGYKKDGYEALRQHYVYPPAGTIPESIRTQLAIYATTPVSSTNHNALLRHDAGLGPQEQAFIDRRLAFVRQTLQRTSSETVSEDGTSQQFFLEEGLRQGVAAPRIAVCCSGGGFRAMIGTLGFWKAMTKTGLVDTILYSSNLSGSTWCSIPWTLGASLEELEACYSKHATKAMADVVASALASTLTKTAKQKMTTDFFWSQPLSSVRGLYAPLLGEMILSFWEDQDLREKTGTQAPYQSSQYLYFWQALDVIKDGTKRPFPLATGLIPYQGNFNARPAKLAEQQRSLHGIWLEYNPEYVGFEYLTAQGTATGAWIPSYAFGRRVEQKIEKKSSFMGLFSKKIGTTYEVQPGPCQTLDYWAGTWGSAFATSFHDLYRIFTNADESSEDSSSIGKRLLHYVLDAASLDPRNQFIKQGVKARLFPAQYNNFALFEDSPFKDNKTLTVVDAGVDFNLPFPPLLRPVRSIDLIITIDLSSGDIPAQQLLLAESWAQKRGLPFPKIKESKELASVSKKPMTLFNEYSAGTQGPAILYIPLMDNQFNAADFSVAECMKHECSTFNFNYNSTVQKLSDHLYRTILGVLPQLKQTLQELVKAKNNGTAFTLSELTPL